MDQEIRDLEAIHQQVQRKREKMLRLAFRGRSMKLQKKYVISRRMIKDEGLNTESLVKKVQPTTIDGMMTFTMVTLLLMMLLPW
jgi:hypothetical protein